MWAEWQIHDLIDLVRQRYPDWEGFAHEGFAEKELGMARREIAYFQEQLAGEVWQGLLNEQRFDEIMSRLRKVSRRTPYLFGWGVGQGDAGILYEKGLDKAEFGLAMRGLLYGGDGVEQRLRQFVLYGQGQGLAMKWSFVTYFLWVAQPQVEWLVKPRLMTWFLQFGGEMVPDWQVVDAGMYMVMRRMARALLTALAPYGAQDMVDVYGFVALCYQESKRRVGGLSVKEQVALDVPPNEGGGMSVLYEAESQGHVLREKEMEEIKMPAYSVAQCGQDTGYEEPVLREWLAGIERKGQAVLYGPPGTGKTFLAEKLGQHLVGGGDGFVSLVQFHPAYSYEDFVQGIRPLTGADGGLYYDWVAGRFLQFCRQAAERTGVCVLIIDEMNRANLPRVLGELMYVLEYRERPIALAGGQVFKMPANVRILGTMNTADRSIALVDYALRRRFAFLSVWPNYEVLRRYHAKTGFDVTGLVKVLQQINERIRDRHYVLGMTFFLRAGLAEEIAGIWQMEIEPYLEEYFFSQPEQVDVFRWERIRSQILK